MSEEIYYIDESILPSSNVDFQVIIYDDTIYVSVMKHQLVFELQSHFLCILPGYCLSILWTRYYYFAGLRSRNWWDSVNVFPIQLCFII